MSKTRQNIDEHRNELKKYLLYLYPDTNVNELIELVEQFSIDKFDK